MIPYKVLKNVDPTEMLSTTRSLCGRLVYTVEAGEAVRLCVE